MAWLIRGVALALGVFLLASGVAGLVSPRLDSTIWVLDVRWMPSALARFMCMSLGLSLVLVGWQGARGVVAKIGLVAGLVLAVLAAFNAGAFFVLVVKDEIGTTFPAPASLLVCVVGLAIVKLSWRSRRSTPEANETPESARQQVRVALAAIASIGVFPFVQMLCFGWTGYRRDANAVLVFGARAFADGSASDALGDRILTACELVREGKCELLILSGGPGDGAFHETDVMRRIAIEQGVDEGKIIVDREGLNTHASIVNAASISKEKGFARLLAVSHFYHLPRVKMEASRAGLTVFTVPADQRGQVLKKLPYFMAREAAAWWWSYAKGMVA